MNRVAERSSAPRSVTRLLKLILVLCIVEFAALILLAGPSSAQIYTVHQSFGKDSGVPAAVALAQGRDGYLYGTFSNDQTTCIGGAFRSPAGNGGLTIYSFSASSECAYPYAGLTLASDGNFYGAIPRGGTYNYGTLFKITPTGTLTVLYNFANQGDGASPEAPPIEGSDGFLYGTTTGVLNGNTMAGSTIYKYAPSGGLTTVYGFGAGQYTMASVIQAADGILYGTTVGSGTNGCGTIFKLTTGGILLATYSFICGTGGAYPYAPLIQASDGNFYGTTQQDCGYSCGYYGTIYRMSRTGVISTIHSFDGTSGGKYPQSGLTEGTDGYLYGAAGVLFRITKSGKYSVLESTSSSKTGYPWAAALIQQTDGSFYGTTPFGGQYDSGTVYSLDMGLGPFITFVLPVAKVGRTAQILGQGLTGTTSVTFNGVAATKFSVVSDTYMTAVVPAGASTGAVLVATPAGNLISNVSFRIMR